MWRHQHVRGLSERELEWWYEAISAICARRPRPRHVLVEAVAPAEVKPIRMEITLKNGQLYAIPIKDGA